MRPMKLSTTRKTLLWFFDDPSNDPYVSLTFDVEVAPMRRFLDAYEREHGERVGLHHAVTKAVARCLVDLPALNVKIVGGAMHALDRVDIAMPVHLPAKKGGDETGMVIVQGVDRMTLGELARATRRRADEERRGTALLGGSAMMRKAARYLPDALLRSGLSAGRLLLSQPTTYRLLQDVFGVSSAVTNVGAVFTMPKGARFRAASATIPAKLGHVASVFGVAPTEEAAIADGGKIEARTVLPVVMIVDHRAIDGVLMATAATRVARALLDPSGEGFSLPGAPGEGLDGGVFPG